MEEEEEEEEKEEEGKEVKSDEVGTAYVLYTMCTYMYPISFYTLYNYYIYIHRVPPTRAISLQQRV